MSHFRIYDEDANNVTTRAFGGKASGIRDWDNIRFPQMLDFSESMQDEFWSKSEIKLGKDVEEYRSKMNDSERYVYNVQTGMLNWLDSIATDFNYALFIMCTAPEIRSVISIINFYETIHNQSYQYLTSTMLNKEEKEQAFEHIRRVSVLEERNKLIIEPIQRLVGSSVDYLKRNNEQTEAEVRIMAEGVLANAILEGLFFSGAFVFFHSLARDQKMIGSNNMINLIKADENHHSAFYGSLFQIIIKENPSLNTKEFNDYCIKYVKKAVELEKEWAKYIFNDIDTMSIKEYHDYVEYLANLICRNAGIGVPFPENTEIKSRWMVTYGSKSRKGNDEMEIATRTDFLQANAVDYLHEGGEDFDL